MFCDIRNYEAHVGHFLDQNGKLGGVVRVSIHCCVEDEHYLVHAAEVTYF